MRTSTTEPVNGPALYMLVFSRLFGIILAAMLIPGAIVPLGLNGAMAGVLTAIATSMLFNLAALIFETCTTLDLPWTMTLLLDVMVFPSILIVFGVLCLSGEVGNGTVDGYKKQRKIMAFILLLLVGLLHILSFAVNCMIVAKRDRPTNHGSYRRSTLTTRPLHNPSRHTGFRSPYQKHRTAPLPRLPSMAASDVLPLYTPNDTHRPPPAYKSADDNAEEQV